MVNSEARGRLPKQMKNAIRLTIYEAKGLEFDDVLLYNFFKDSQVWKIMKQHIYFMAVAVLFPVVISVSEEIN